MSLITTAEAAKILGISKRTLFRWEKEGRIRSKREGILKVRVFDSDYVHMARKILDLNNQERGHLAKLPKIQEQIKKDYLLQPYNPGKPLELITPDKLETGIKAFKDEEKWMAEHRRLLDELFSYPRDIIRELLKT